VPLLPGVGKLVHHLKANDIPIAIATGSRRRNYELKTGHLQSVFGCFEGKVICGDDADHSIKGKPAPDIFIIAAKELLSRDVGPIKDSITERQREERIKGLVFEDGLPGMQAGKRARMSGSFCLHNLLINAETWLTQLYGFLIVTSWMSAIPERREPIRF
jgi:pseudouridine-5'-monophosphatase